MSAWVTASFGSLVPSSGGWTASYWIPNCWNGSLRVVPMLWAVELMEKGLNPARHIKGGDAVLDEGE